MNNSKDWMDIQVRLLPTILAIVISSSPLSKVLPKVRVKVFLNCAKFHTKILNCDHSPLQSVGRNTTKNLWTWFLCSQQEWKILEREETPCKGQKLLLFTKGPSKLFTLYSGIPLNCIAKGKIEKCWCYLKCTGKSARIPKSGQNLDNLMGKE